MARHVAVGAAALGVVVAVAVVSVLWPLGGASRGKPDGPVIPLGEDWNSYPTAQVTGPLTLVEDCLLLGDSVVFWPHGTSWDEDAQAVEFGGDFDGSPAAVVGEEFTGGGGFYSSSNVDGLDGLDAEAVQACVRTTGAGGAVMAYPGS